MAYTKMQDCRLFNWMSQVYDVIHEEVNLIYVELYHSIPTDR